ncbi:MAG: nucleotidyltransferase domain-containing protein [bacterium]
MSSVVRKLARLRNTVDTLKTFQPPQHVVAGLQYETIMGSEAYGVSSGNSDRDIYGFSIPTKDMVFPHLAGEIVGFGRTAKRFEQWEQHHVKHGDYVYDFSIYSLVRYFTLLMENNPNIIDSIFTPARCVLYSTQLAEHVRSNRRVFLHKGSWHRFKGYAYAQLHKMKIKSPQPGSKRADDVKQHGFDRKFAYHIVRLIGEAEQILADGNIDLERDRERLKAIRAGEMSEENIEQFFTDKEKVLERLYHESALPYRPDQEAIKKLLLECLEMHFGSLTEAEIRLPGKVENALRTIVKTANEALGET